MKLSIDKFIFLYQNVFKTLNDHQRLGLTELATFINSDDQLTDCRHVAYLLATVKHETADTYLPISERGHGKNKPYGVVVPATGAVYYGRGYCQITWADNYHTLGSKIGVDLYHNPDLALQPDIAYRIISYGMRHGSFTGVGLSKYINKEKCDYVNARRIVNILDCAEKIAGYAMQFEVILKECI